MKLPIAKLSRTPLLAFGLLLSAGAPLALALFPAPLSAQTSDAELRKVLGQMDAAAGKFQSAQADFVWDEFEAAVQSTDQQSGKISFARHGGQVEMAAMIEKPVEKDVVFASGELQLFEPNIKHLTVIAAGKNQVQYESFLTLGFGGGGADLEKIWTVTYQGHESVSGTDTAKLDLVAKQQSIRNLFAHVTLWIDPQRGISIKQQFFEPSGDYRIVHYTNIVANPKLSADTFKLKIPAGTTVLHK